jgi:hypothetical protein
MLTRLNPIKPKQSPSTARRKNSQIFIDKIVDRRSEPTLFNIESARMSAQLTTGPYRYTRQLRQAGRETRRDVIARDTLAMMNVTVSQLDENFSLLESNSNKRTILNPNIMDSVDFANTVNSAILSIDKFVSDSDPFYELDEAVNTPQEYKNIKADIDGKSAHEPDLSFILSNMTILNQSTTYFGKNKYF